MAKTPTATNTAADNARVEAQIGVVQGNVVLHGDIDIYRLGDGESPERQFEVARNNLSGGAGRIAEGLFAGLLNAGHGNAQVAYYTLLAVADERTARDIGPREAALIERALSVGCTADGQWREAFDVVRALLVRALDWADGDGLHEVLGRLDRLHPDRRSEVLRHFGMLLEGEDEAELLRRNERLIAEKRMGGSRETQAWKFFEPEPVKPRRISSWNPGARSFLHFLLVLAAGGTLVGITPLVDSTPLLSLLDVHLLVLPELTTQERLYVATTLVPHGFLIAGMLLAGTAWAPVALRGARRRGRAAERALRRLPPLALTSSQREFADDVAAMVLRRVAAQKVDRPGRWRRDTAGLRWAIAGELVGTYAWADVPAPALTWLVRLRVGDLLHRWRSGTLEEADDPPRTTALVWYGVGWLLMVSGFFAPLALGVDLHPEYGITLDFDRLFTQDSWVVGALGVPLIAHGIAGLAAAAAVALEGRRARARLHGQDLEAFAALERELEVIPTDAQLAEWLDYDKTHIRTLAQHSAGLAADDVFAHVVLTEGAAGATKARVPLGVPRYSAYVVRVFLLTGTGVREVEVDLDTLTGEVTDERRRSFGYQALAAAEIVRVGVTLDGGKRTVSESGADPDSAISQAFRLTLVSGHLITVVMEDFEGLSDEDDVEDNLRLLALESAGALRALRVLESVACEGRDWTARERERRRTRVLRRGPRVNGRT